MEINQKKILIKVEKCHCGEKYDQPAWISIYHNYYCDNCYENNKTGNFNFKTGVIKSMEQWKKQQAVKYEN